MAHRVEIARLWVAAAVLAAGAAAGAAAQSPRSAFQDGHMGGNCSSCHGGRSSTRYEFDATQTLVVYSVEAYGFKAVGTLGGVSGGFVFDPSEPEAASVLANVALDGLSARHAALDSLLLSDRFLDAAGHPVASFRSTSAEAVADNTLRVEGILSLRGMEHPLALEVRLNGRGRHAVTGRQTAGFVARGRFSRSEFGMILGQPAIADEVELTIYAQGNLLN